MNRSETYTALQQNTIDAIDTESFKSAARASYDRYLNSPVTGGMSEADAKAYVAAFTGE